ncbi:MAG: hypothetical protein IKQ91_11165 [Oscillospiraceae bacterium]|nr:hypothetical protein [Oscillospiraceae bacterium]
MAEELENDEALQEQYDEAIANALDIVAEKSGLKDEYGDDYAEIMEKQSEEETESEESESDVKTAQKTAEDAETEDDTAEADAPAEESAEPEEKTEDPDAIPAVDGERVIIGGSGDGVDEVQAARSMFLDVDAVQQRVEATGRDQAQTIQDLQKVANFMTDAIVGAEVELTFAPGETEKFIEIIPIQYHQ